MRAKGIMVRASSLIALCCICAAGVAAAQTAPQPAAAPGASPAPAPAAAPQVAAPPVAAPGAPAAQGAATVERSQPASADVLAPQAGNSYEIMLRELDEKVSDLKERIFRSKARLILLKETVLHGAVSGSKAVLVHRNEMGSSFRLERVLYSLDGAPIFQKQDQGGDLDEREEFEIFHGAIVPGQHNLSVYLEYRGHGFGIFSYLEGYVFKIRSSFGFTAEEGKVVRIKVVGYEKGGITTDLKERPSVRFDMELLKDEPEPQALSGGASEK